jgi:uncharacterized protein with LGFP repeats
MTTLHSPSGCRAALSKLRAAIGDEALPIVILGTGAGPDAADVVPADSDSSPTQSSTGAATGGSQAAKDTAVIPSSSLNARLATLERSMSAANKATCVTSRSTSIAATALPSSSLAAASNPGFSVDSDIAERVAALEAQLSQLRLPVSGLSLGHDSQNPAGVSSIQPEQAGSAQLTDRLSQLQQQIEALTIDKANKADLEALQLRTAVLGGGGIGSGSGDSNSSGGSSGRGGSNSDGNAAMGNNGAATGMHHLHVHLTVNLLHHMFVSVSQLAKPFRSCQDVCV